MPETHHTIDPRDQELGLLQDQLLRNESALDKANREFRSRTDVVVSRAPFESAILGIRSRIAQLQDERNPKPELFNPKVRAKKL